MNTIPINTKKPLLIPINCKLGQSNTCNHWIMAARFQNQDDIDMEWDFVFADSYNLDQTVTGAKNAIADKTTLHLQTRQMDCPDPMAPEVQTSATYQGAVIRIILHRMLENRFEAHRPLDLYFAVAKKDVSAPQTLMTS